MAPVAQCAAGARPLAFRVGRLLSQDRRETMTYYWALAALWLGLALVATLAIRSGYAIATALSEIVVGTIAQLIIGAVDRSRGAGYAGDVGDVPIRRGRDHPDLSCRGGTRPNSVQGRSGRKRRGWGSSASPLRSLGARPWRIIVLGWVRHAKLARGRSSFHDIGRGRLRRDARNRVSIKRSTARSFSQPASSTTWRQCWRSG